MERIAATWGFPMSNSTATEQVAGSLAGAAKKRRGRKPKIRHDAGPAPVDGDYDKLSLENEDPGYRYYRVNAKDLHRLKRWGAEECRYGVDSVRPREWFGEGKDGEVIRMESLTVVKLRKDVAAKMDAADPRRARHQILMGRMAEHAKSGNGTFEAKQSSIQIPV